MSSASLQQDISFGENTILEIVFFMIIWIFIPLVIASMLVFAILLAIKSIRGENRVSAVSGIFAGLILFSTYVATQVSDISQNGDPSFSVQGFTFTGLPVGAGLALGFGAPWLIRLLRNYTNLVGVLTLLLTAAGTLALFNYFFASQFRDFTVLLSLSVLFGVLLHAVFIPGSLSHYRGTDGRRG